MGRAKPWRSSWVNPAHSARKAPTATGSCWGTPSASSASSAARVITGAAAARCQNKIFGDGHSWRRTAKGILKDAADQFCPAVLGPPGNCLAGNGNASGIDHEGACHCIQERGFA